MITLMVRDGICARCGRDKIMNFAIIEDVDQEHLLLLCPMCAEWLFRRLASYLGIKLVTEEQPTKKTKRKTKKGRKK